MLQGCDYHLYEGDDEQAIPVRWHRLHAQWLQKRIA